MVRGEGPGRPLGDWQQTAVVASVEAPKANGRLVVQQQTAALFKRPALGLPQHWTLADSEWRVVRLLGGSWEIGSR